jgi:hypothetical protein
MLLDRGENGTTPNNGHLIGSLAFHTPDGSHGVFFIPA